MLLIQNCSAGMTVNGCVRLPAQLSAKLDTSLPLPCRQSQRQSLPAFLC